MLISEFLKNNSDSIVLIDGLDYLISRSSFPSVFKLIQDKRLDALDANSVLLFPIDREALEEIEVSLYSELKTLIDWHSYLEQGE